MRKKDLLALPVAVPDPAPANGRIIKYHACARLHELDGQKLLAIDCFDATCTALLHRVFLFRMKYLTASYEGPQRACKWHSGKMAPILTEFFHKPFQVVYPLPDQKSREAIEEFLGFDAGNDLFQTLCDYQRDIEGVRLRMKHQKEMDGIRAVMSHVKPLPEGFVKWVDTEVMKGSQYMFYQYTGAKAQPAFCSVCCSTVKAKGLKYRRMCVCPNCSAELTAIADGRMKNGHIQDTAYASIAQAFGSDVMVRIFKVYRIFKRVDGAWRVETRHRETIRDIVMHDGQYKTYAAGYYKHDTDNGLGFVPFSQCWNHYIYPPAPLYPRGIRDELDGTYAHYSGIECLAEKGDAFRADEYFHFYTKYPQAEMLLRRGATGFVRYLVERPSFDHSIPQYMDTIRKHFKDLKDGDMGAVHVWKEVDASRYSATAEDVAKWGTTSTYSYLLPRLLRFAPLSKINDYIDKVIQNPKMLQLNIRGVQSASVISQYLADYWDNAYKIGMNMQDKRVLYPENLGRAHDDAADRFEVVKSERVQKLLKERFTELIKKFRYAIGGLCIVIPSCVEDFIKESRALNHCVRTYAERVAFNETTILFVRNEEKLDQPFYTMEVKDGRVVQLRGENNCAPTDAVLGFERGFCKAFGLQELAA